MNSGHYLIATFALLAVLASQVPATEQADPTSHRDINVSQAEDLILSEVNNRRQNVGLERLEPNEQASAAAAEHAADMARQNYVNHTAKDGESVAQRYACPAGENIYQTWVLRDVDEVEQSYIGNESELASAIVTGWMDSKPHKQNIKNSNWDSSGVGVAITDDNKVYAVMAYCR